VALATMRADFGNDQVPHDQIVGTISPKIQQLIVLPTEKCNFRCTYCYEDFKIGKMPEVVQASIERFMDRRIPELSHFALHWFGGEPLVARNIVTRLSSYAHRLCEEFGISLSGSITTNAYLLEQSLFRELVSYRQRFFQITLDGCEEEHNAVRKLANGRGTFERIWSNLVATKKVEEEFTIQIRIHARRQNYMSLKALVRQLAQEFGRDGRYQLDFQHLRDLGGEGGKSIENGLSLTELRTLEVELREDYASAVNEFHGPPTLSQLTDESDLSGVGSEQPRHVEICYAAKPNSLLIRADGRIGKCTVALTDDRNTLGSINPDGTVSIDNRKLRPWIRGLSSLDLGELACPLVYMAEADLS